MSFFLEPEEWEEFDGDEDTIDLRAYNVMGPIFHVDLLQLPPQPKTVSTWVMTTSKHESFSKQYNMECVV